MLEVMKGHLNVISMIGNKRTTMELNIVLVELYVKTDSSDLG